MPKRVSTFSTDLADGSILCQAVASHVPHFAIKGGPLHGFIPVHSTGEKTKISPRCCVERRLLRYLQTLMEVQHDTLFCQRASSVDGNDLYGACVYMLFSSRGFRSLLLFLFAIQQSIFFSCRIVVQAWAHFGLSLTPCV